MNLRVRSVTGCSRSAMIAVMWRATSADRRNLLLEDANVDELRDTDFCGGFDFDMWESLSENGCAKLQRYAVLG